MEVRAKLKSGELTYKVAVRYAVKGFSDIKEDGTDLVTVIKLTKPVMN